MLKEVSAQEIPFSSHVVKELSALLADTYSLALKTQNYHWNVKGTEFYSLHKLFESQYEELYDAADLLAERIRALGSYAPGSFSEFAKLTSISEAQRNVDAGIMIKDLVNGHESAVIQAKQAIIAAEATGDAATVDIIVGRIEGHQKQAWMLQSIIE